MNGFAVVSREFDSGKAGFFQPERFIRNFPYSIRPSTFSLPPRQTANGVVDAFVHVMEQYMTFDIGSPLQDRQAEAILVDADRRRARR